MTHRFGNWINIGITAFSLLAAIPSQSQASDCSKLLSQSAASRAPAPHQGKRYKTREMRSKFAEKDRRHGVSYFSAAEREAARVFVRDGRLFWTRGEEVSADGLLSIVMDESGNIYIYPGTHSAALEGRPTAFAGEGRFKRGKARLFNDRSGHYRPKVKDLKRFLEQLREDGADLSETEIVSKSAYVNDEKDELDRLNRKLGLRAVAIKEY